MATTSNGRYLAVKYQSGEIKLYNDTGGIVYTTANSGVGAGTCPAVMNPEGGIMTADQERIYRFDQAGSVLWSTPLPYFGRPAVNNPAGRYTCGSLKVTPNGQVTVMTINGPLATVHTGTGAPAGTPLWPGGSASTSYFGGNNSGCSEGNRIYQVGTLWSSGKQGMQAVLTAIDVSSAGLRLSAISPQFMGPSSASPMCAMVNGEIVIYTDYDSTSGGSHRPGVMALEDDGDRLTVLWTRDTTAIAGVNNRVNSNYALDPVGFGGRRCAWVYVTKVPDLYCLDLATGATVSRIDTGAPFLHPDRPATMGSDRTMSVNPANGHSIMVTAMNVSGGAAYVVCLDATAGVLLWRFKMAESSSADNAPGQFPAIYSGSGTRLGFALNRSGMDLIGHR